MRIRRGCRRPSSMADAAAPRVQRRRPCGRGRPPRRRAKFDRKCGGSCRGSLMEPAAGRKDFGCNEVTTEDEELERLCAIVTAVAKRELLPRFNATARTEKQDGSVVTEADLAAQAELKRALAASWPRYEFLGE